MLCGDYHHWERLCRRTWKITIFFHVCLIANQLLARLSLCLAQWMNANVSSFWNERVRYRIEHERRNTISPCFQVLFSIYIIQTNNKCYILSFYLNLKVEVRCLYRWDEISLALHTLLQLLLAAWDNPSWRAPQSGHIAPGDQKSLVLPR